MSNDETGSPGGLLDRFPSSVRLGGGLVLLVYGLALLTDSIEDPIPSDVKGIMWVVVGIGLLVYAVGVDRGS